MKYSRFLWNFFGSAKKRRLLMLMVLLVFLINLSSCKKDKSEPTIDLIVLQLRWCVLEGSSEAKGKSAGELVSTPRTARDRLLEASDIWAPAKILFIAVVITAADGQKGIPVIADPFVPKGGIIGDISVAPGSADASFAAVACDARWNRLDSSLKGPVVVSARKFSKGIALAVASSPVKALWVKQASPLTGKRGDDMCGEPRKLTHNDVFNLSPSNGSGQGWLVLQEPSQYDSNGHLARNLAHELGHVLFLGHGNGIDDNSDGAVTGFGPRRFDAYCDPLGVAANGKPLEDEQACSLMGRFASCTTITSLQIEMARAVAKLLPGCSGSSCLD